MVLKKYFNYLILALIILIAFVTRYYKLGDAPSGFYVDEAGQGYSAYSILMTGKDEFGKSFPIVFRSLTDFKTPVYIYLIVPLIPLFGLTPFTVRLPSFIFSVLTIPILYFLIKHLSKNEKLSLITVTLLAISPWHILFGRTNFECNVALFFYLSGVLSFFKSLNKPKFLILSALMFAIAIPAYHSQRIITPLTLLILLIKYKSIIFSKTHRLFFILGILLGSVILAPTISIITTPGFLARASGLNIFTNTGGHNSILYTVREFFGLYFSYFSPRFMFDFGDYGLRSSFPELSTFFVWQFPFYLYGLWILFKEKLPRDLKFFTLMLLAIGPIPAAVTRDPYTTIRSLPMVIPQIVIISLAISKLINSKLRVLIFMALCGYSILKLYSSVIILNEYYRPKYWDWGWQAVAKDVGDKKIPVVVDNVRADPDLTLAFFLKYDPSKYQSENYEVPLQEYYTNLHRNTEKHIGNITTRPISWKDDLGKSEILVGDELAISQEQIEIHKLKLLDEIKYPDGSVAYRIVQTNPKFFEEEQRLFKLKQS